MSARGQMQTLYQLFYFAAAALTNFKKRRTTAKIIAARCEIQNGLRLHGASEATVHHAFHVHQLQGGWNEGYAEAHGDEAKG